MAAFARVHAGPGGKVGFVAINVNALDEGNDLATMRRRQETRPYGFTYLCDDGQKTGLAYDVEINPEYFVLGRQRRVVYRGRLDDHENPMQVKQHYLEAAVQATLAGRAPAVCRTDPLGCPVSYRVKK